MCTTYLDCFIGIPSLTKIIHKLSIRTQVAEFHDPMRAIDGTVLSGSLLFNLTDPLLAEYGWRSVSLLVKRGVSPVALGLLVQMTTQGVLIRTIVPYELERVEDGTRLKDGNPNRCENEEGP